MAEEKVIQEKDFAKNPENQKPEPKFFEFGDAFFECSRCGNYERLQKGVKDGMQFVLPTSDQHEWRLVCGKCKNMMRIFFKESDEETVKEAKEKLAEEEVTKKKEAEEAALEKGKKELKDEHKTKNKQKVPAKGNTPAVERSSSDDGKGDATPTPDN